MAPTATESAASKASNGAGVKKATGRPKKTDKREKAKVAMIKMQAFFKENRSKYKDMDYKEQQKELGKEWKTSPENPKNKA